MWKVLKRGVLLKCGKSVKASSVIGNCDDVPKQRTSTVSETCNHWAGHFREYHSSYEDSGGGHGRDGPECKWRQRMNFCEFDMWASTHGCWHILEAVGWGTAVITGLQITDLCRRSHQRNEYGDENRCWISNIVNGASTVHWAGFGELFHRYSQNTVSIVSRVVGSGLLSSKSILPSNAQQTKSVAECKNDSEPEPGVPRFMKPIPSTQNDSADVLHESVLQLSSATTSFLSQHHATEAQTHTSADGEVSWQTLARQCVAAVQCNVDALAYVKQGQMASAVRLWKQSCSCSVCSPSSLFNLALCYEQGLGVTQDIDKAIEMYDKAAELGHAKSAFNLAMLLLKDDVCSAKNFQKAMKYLQMAADLNLKEAQRELGVLYTESSSQDMTKAVALFEQASAQKDARATYFLGICYEKGLGVDRNEVKAASLYKIAGALGHIDALYNLAVFFENGLGGLPVDFDEAIQYYQASAAAGHKQAVDRLITLNSQHPRLAAVDVEGIKAKTIVGDVKSAIASADHAMHSPISHLLKFSVSSDSDWCDSSMSDYDLSASNSSASSNDNSLWQLTPVKGSSNVFHVHVSNPKDIVSTPNTQHSERSEISCSPDEGNLSLEIDSFDGVSSLTGTGTVRDVGAFPEGRFGKSAMPYLA